MITLERWIKMIHSTVDLSENVSIHASTSIWHYAQVREDASIGENCTIGRGAYIGAGVHLGSNCKIQNYALIYEPAVIHDGVFIGPAAVLTNDQYPRAVNPDLSIKKGSDWTPVGVVVRKGASIGARAVCVAPVVIGEWALVAAGAVVKKDVKAFSIVAGAPAKHIGWVGKSGVPLQQLSESEFVCPKSGEKYKLVNEELTEELN